MSSWWWLASWVGGRPKECFKKYSTHASLVVEVGDESQKKTTDNDKGCFPWKDFFLKARRHHWTTNQIYWLNDFEFRTPKNLFPGFLFFLHAGVSMKCDLNQISWGDMNLVQFGFGLSSGLPKIVIHNSIKIPLEDGCSSYETLQHFLALLHRSRQAPRTHTHTHRKMREASHTHELWASELFHSNDLKKLGVKPFYMERSVWGVQSFGPYGHVHIKKCHQRVMLGLQVHC